MASVCQVTQENGLNGFIRFVVISCQEEPLLGFSAYEHLSLLNRIASVGKKCPNAAAILEGARGGVPDTKIYSDPVAAQYADVFQGLGFLQE